ncbi:MAG: fucose 4-O-acetylase, partial [Blautia faecis]
GIYFFHYPIMILMNGLMILNIPQLMNVWALFGVSLLFVLILGSLPVDWIYTNIMGLITFILFKREKKVEDEGLEDEYDNEEEDRFAVLAQRRMAIEELAATWDTSFDTEEKEEHEEGQS